MITYQTNLPKSTSALSSGKLNWQQMDGDKPLEQITNNLVLLEYALQDPEHIGENLDAMLMMVNSLKVFGISSLIKKSCYDLSEDGLHDLPDELRFNLTADDASRIEETTGVGFWNEQNKR